MQAAPDRKQTESPTHQGAVSRDVLEAGVDQHATTHEHLQTYVKAKRERRGRGARSDE